MAHTGNEYLQMSPAFTKSTTAKFQKLNPPQGTQGFTELNYAITYKDLNSFSPPVRHSLLDCDSLENIENTERIKSTETIPFTEAV
jgi:hypothetical protein